MFEYLLNNCQEAVVMTFIFKSIEMVVIHGSLLFITGIIYRI